jgi:hypothetical protein
MRPINIAEELAGRDVVSAREHSGPVDGTYDQKIHIQRDGDSMRTAMVAAPQLEQNVRERRRRVWLRRSPPCYALGLELSGCEEVVF